MELPYLSRFFPLATMSTRFLVLILIIFVRTHISNVMVSFTGTSLSIVIPVRTNIINGIMVPFPMLSISVFFLLLPIFFLLAVAIICIDRFIIWFLFLRTFLPFFSVTVSIFLLSLLLLPSLLFLSFFLLFSLKIQLAAYISWTKLLYDKIN